MIFLPTCIGSLSVTHAEIAPLCRRDTSSDEKSELEINVLTTQVHGDDPVLASSLAAWRSCLQTGKKLQQGGKRAFPSKQPLNWF